MINDKRYCRDDLTISTDSRVQAADNWNCSPAGTTPQSWPTSDIVAPKNRVVLSNMLEIENREDPTDSSFYVVKFATTSTIMSMSTYLVAIVVGEFDYIEDKTEEGIRCRFYSLLGKKEQGRLGSHLVLL